MLAKTNAVEKQGKRIWGEMEVNGPETKLEIRTRKKLLAVGEACMALF